MAYGDLPGMGMPRVIPLHGTNVEQVAVRQPVHRILAFLGRSIDEVCNDPIVRNQVFGYYKLYRQIERSGEITELERTWNVLGMRF